LIIFLPEKYVIKDYKAVLDEYYEACGWDIETGIPCFNKLQELELEDYR